MLSTGQALLIDNHFRVVLGLRRTTLSDTLLCRPGRLITGRGAIVGLDSFAPGLHLSAMSLRPRPLAARFIAPCLPTKTDPPRLRQTGIHFILTSKMQTGDYGQLQRPGRLGHDFGGRLLLGSSCRERVIRSLEATMRCPRSAKRGGEEAAAEAALENCRALSPTQTRWGSSMLPASP